MSKRKPRDSDGSALSKRWEDEDFKKRQLKMRKLYRIKSKTPPEIKKEMKNLDDDTIIELYGHYSVKQYPNRTKNTSLKDRKEVHKIKEYKKKFKITNDPITSRGWYRKSTKDLINILEIYEQKYGEL